MSDKKTALVISAHAADFVWRCGGAIALHAGRARVEVDDPPLVQGEARLPELRRAHPAQRPELARVLLPRERGRGEARGGRPRQPEQP